MMAIMREAEMAMTVPQELALARSAFARAATPAMRARLARLLVLEEAFKDVIALLSPADDLSYRELTLLTTAFLSAETQLGNEDALAAAERALAIASGAAEAANALALRGKAETRLGCVVEARASLSRALEIDPQNKDACKRIASLDLSAGEFEAAIARMNRLAEQGAAHARLFAATALAQAQQGDLAAARATLGLDRFRQSEILPPPTGWNSRDDFHAALTKELLTHRALRFGRYGSASELTWRIEYLGHREAPLTRLLTDHIEAALQRRIAAMPSDGHPWLAARPGKAFLRAWCVITESHGFENWHVHQFGWLSGVYYVRMPRSVSHGSNRGGCLGFGLPHDLAGEIAAQRFGEEIIRPQEGMLLTFPSHVYHRTYPHGTAEKRICVAFDLREG